MYEGLWCKLLRPDPTQRAIVADVPGMPRRWVPAALGGIGALETAVAGWVLSGARAREAAWAQTAMLAAFNAGGLACARTRIAHPARMLLRNAALLAAAWSLGGPRPRRGGRG